MYTLTFDQWDALGNPDIEEYTIDITDEGYVLDIDPTDEDGNGIPDFLDNISGGGDIIYNPSQGTDGV